MKLFIFIMLFSANAFGWTLNSSTSMKYSTSSIKIKIASDTCPNAGLNPASIENLVNESIDEFWNSIPTSSIDLSSSGNSGIAFNNLSSLGSAVALTTKNTIIVGCSNDATLFSSAGTLAVGGLGCAGSSCSGAVILNDKAGTYLAIVDRQTLVSTFAHELGHALGLGHSSVQEALMYYSLSNKTQKALNQDDIDGISYLYPNEKKLSGFAGACGTVDFENKNDKGGNNFLTSLVLGLFLIAFVKKLMSSISFLRIHKHLRL